jgi:hypothetical protein
LWRDQQKTGSEILRKIYMNNSNLQNLTGGTFFYAGGIFNETGESTAYIMTDQKEVYITKLETAN